MAMQRIETTDGQGNVLEVREVDVVDVPDPLADALAEVEAAMTFAELKSATVAYLALVQ